jgi:hypothetical protein
MEPSVPIMLAVEDALSEAMAREILFQSSRSFSIGACYRRGGYGYLKNKISGFNQAAKGVPFFVLADLDQYACPPDMIADWMNCPPDQVAQWMKTNKHPNLIFRVAVREVESWVMADREAFALFLGIRRELMPEDTDQLPDAKQFLMGLVRKSRKRDLRTSILPSPRSTAKQGPDYNGPLIGFVQKHWKANQAARHSPSLKRAIRAIAEFAQAW